MNTLTVEFHGICVHFNRDENPSLDLPTPHRILLPFVKDGFTWDGKTILVHQPQVSVQSNTVVSPFAPMFMTLTLSALTDHSEVTTTFNCPPRLKTIFPEMELRPEVVTEGAAPATTYFDIREGTLSGIEIEGSAGTRLTIETELSAVVLTKTLWHHESEHHPSGHHHPSVDPVTIELPALITVSNFAKDPDSDFEADFILSFTVGSPFPPPVTKPLLDGLEHALGDVTICLKAANQDIGPGCSNSQFP
jgi:hypothetical protein